MAINGDLYANFAYCKCTGPVGAGDTTIVVDDISRLPTILQDGTAFGDVIPAFWMTFDSALGATNTFEIVRVTNVDATTKTLTVARGQEGTAAVAHDAGTYLKGTFTADMARRAAGADLVTALTDPIPGAGGASGRLALRTNNTTTHDFVVPYAWTESSGEGGSSGAWLPLDGWAPNAACAMAWDSGSADPLIVINPDTPDGLGEYVTNGSLGAGKYVLGLPPSAGNPGSSPNFTESVNQLYAGDPQVATDVATLTTAGRCWVAVRYLLTLTGLAEGDVVAFSTNELSQGHVTQTVLDVVKYPDSGWYDVAGIAVQQPGAAVSYGPQIALKTAATDVAVVRMYLTFSLLAGNPLA